MISARFFGVGDYRNTGDNKDSDDSFLFDLIDSLQNGCLDGCIDGLTVDATAFNIAESSTMHTSTDAV